MAGILIVNDFATQSAQAGREGQTKVDLISRSVYILRLRLNAKSFSPPKFSRQ